MKTANFLPIELCKKIQEKTNIKSLFVYNMEINNPKYNIGDTVYFKYHGFLSTGKIFNINIEISEDGTEIRYWIKTKNSTFSIKEEFITKVDN